MLHITPVTTTKTLHPGPGDLDRGSTLFLVRQGTSGEKAGPTGQIVDFLLEKSGSGHSIHFLWK